MDSNTHFTDQTIAIVGLGLMGGSFAHRFHALGCHVIGLNRTKSVAETAKNLHLVDSIEEGDLKKADIVIFCTPAEATLSFIRDHLDLFKEGAVLTDIAGVKKDFSRRIRTFLRKDLDFVSGHPMCGREGAGLFQSDGGIFQNANYILIPEEGNTEEHLKLIENMAYALGCSHVAIVSAEEHDRAIAYTSDLTHVLATALINSDSFHGNTKYFTGGSFRDMTRIADINAWLWRELFLANREKLLDEIDRFSSALSEIREALDEKDGERIEAFLDKAGQRKRAMKNGNG